MTRITDYNQHMTMISHLMRASEEQSATEQQIATGKKVNSFADIPGDTGVLLSAKRVEANLDQFTRTATEVMNRLNVQDVQLRELETAGGDLRQLVTQAIATGSGLNFGEELEGIFTRVVNILNASVDGKYLYAGTRTDVPPVNVGSLDELVALASVDDAFENNGLKRSVAIDEGEVVEFGVLAKDLARDLFQQMADIKAFNDGVNGPINNTLTPTQENYLKSTIPNIISINTGITSHVALNGRMMNTVEDALIRHEEETVYIKDFIGSIEDVDLSEAVSRLSLNQMQTEATARVISQLSRISLLDFL